jgi:orotate phosphoribosyltransferase
MEDLSRKDKKLEVLIKELYRIEAIKFGDFLLASGKRAPYYIDLRVLPSYPDMLLSVGELIAKRALEIKPDKLIGVAYAGIPLTIAASILSKIPACYIRKELKNHGIPKLIEGKIDENDKVLVIDDVITDGASKIETIERIKQTNIKCDFLGVLVFVDREEGGKEYLKAKGIELYSILKFSDILQTLYKDNLIDKETYEKSIDYLLSNRN